MVINLFNIDNSNSNTNFSQADTNIFKSIDSCIYKSKFDDKNKKSLAFKAGNAEKNNVLTNDN